MQVILELKLMAFGAGTESGLGLKNYPYKEIGFLVTQNQGGQNNDGQNWNNSKGRVANACIMALCCV